MQLGGVELRSDVVDEKIEARAAAVARQRSEGDVGTGPGQAAGAGSLAPHNVLALRCPFKDCGAVNDYKWADDKAKKMCAAPSRRRRAPCRAAYRDPCARPSPLTCTPLASAPAPRQLRAVQRVPASLRPQAGGAQGGRGVAAGDDQAHLLLRPAEEAALQGEQRRRRAETRALGRSVSAATPPRRCRPRPAASYLGGPPASSPAALSDAAASRQCSVCCNPACEGGRV